MTYTRTVRRSVGATALAAALALAGCWGSGEPEPEAKVTETSTVTTTVTTSPATPPEAPNDEPDEITEALSEAIDGVLSAHGGEAAVVVFAPEAEAAAGEVGDDTAWSTMKVPVAMAALAEGAGSAADVDAALRASDNEAAERLWQALGPGREAAAKAEAQIGRLAPAPAVPAAAPRPGFSAFGQTQWALADQARFAYELPCDALGRDILRPLSAPAEGLGFGLSGVGVPAKAGWGPDEGSRYLVRQFGRVEGFGVAVAVRPAAGTFEAGQAALTDLAGALPSALVGRADGCEAR